MPAPNSIHVIRGPAIVEVWGRLVGPIFNVCPKPINMLFFFSEEVINGYNASNSCAASAIYRTIG